MLIRKQVIYMFDALKHILSGQHQFASGCLGRWRTIVGAVQKGEISGIWQIWAGRKETHFSRMFRRQLGYSPREYRRLHAAKKK
jgi:hypothetical protein